MSLRRSRHERSAADGAAVNDRAAARVAWPVWAVSCIMLVLTVVLSIQVETVAISLWFVSFGAVLAAFATVGAVVAARHSHNAVDGCVSPSDFSAA